MHFFSRRNASLALSLAAVGVLAACGDDVTVPVAPPAPVTVSITPQAVSLNPGASATLSVQIAGGDPTPTLASCATGAASVATAAVSGSSCTVTAVAPGATTITATTSSGQSASAAVTVNALPSAINGDLAVSPATAAISVGQQVTLVPSLNLGGSGVTTTYTYAVEPAGIVSLSGTGNNRTVTAVAPGVATVTVSVTASGTGFTSATRQAAVTINVSAAPPALTGLTVSPASLSIPTGGVSQLAATVTQPAGATAATYTFESSNETVATVSGTGSNRTITAIAPGTATITVTATAPATATLSAATLTQLVPVTVSPIANVTIQALRQGPTSTSYVTTINAEGLVTANNPQVNQPVDINNVKDQIQVIMNLQSNGQRVDSLVVYVGDGNDANRIAAARQVFTNGDASQAGVIELPINTADFELDWSVGVADIKYPNGLKVLSASVWTTNAAGQTQQIQNASNNRLSVNFANIDSWSARYRYPTRVAQGGQGSNSNLNWYGGPDEAGAGDFTVVPVFYTPGRTIKQFNARQVVLGDNAGAITTMADANSANICALRSFNDQSPTPYFTKYGYANVTDVTSSCQGFEHPQVVNALLDARNYVTVFNTIDNSNNPGPFVRRLSGFRTNLQRGITQPVPNRLDYQVASVTVGLTPQVTGAEIGWVNGVYSFVTSTTESDAGVGLPTPLGQTYTWTGCATGNGGTNVSFDGLVKPAGAAGEIPECSNDFLGGATFNGPYTVTATQADVLGNVGTGTSNQFGVDKTAPEMQFIDSQSLASIQPAAAQGFVIPTTADSIFDNATTTYTSAATAINGATAVNSTNAHFGVRYRDERAGFQQNNHGTRNLTRWAPAASPLLSNVSVSTNVMGPEFRTLNYDGVNAANLLQESVVDTNDPTFRRDSVAIFGVGTTAATATAPGYYFYQITVVDRAGNSNSRNRTAAIDITSPVVTGVTIPAVLQGGSQLTFNPTGNDDLEAIDGDLFINYPTMALAGDNVADPNAVANQNGRLRFRRNLFTNWHDAWLGASRNTTIINSDGLLSTPFGPGAALSSGGLTLPVGFYQRIEVVQAAGANEDQGPHGRPVITRLPSQPNLAAIPTHATLTALNQFKPTLLGVYAFDIRATSAVQFPNRGMSSEQNPANESAYLENLFAANITQPTAVDYWATRDIDPSAGTQLLWSWYCFSRSGTTVECRAETGTNVVNSPFARVDYYRWKATANTGLVAADAAATAGQWIYLGSTNPNVPVNPIIQDQGVTRFWRFQFTFAGFGTTQNQPENTEAGFAANDVIRAIGVDAQGNAISTLNFTLP